MQVINQQQKMVVLASPITMSSAAIMGSSSTLLLHSQPHKSLLNLPNSRINSHSLSLSSSSSLSIGGNGVPHPPLSTPAFAVAADTTQPSSTSDQDQTTKKYYFVVANAKFMLDEEEHFQEQLFEKRRYYGESNKEQDFWLVIEPKFLENFPDITKRLKRPAVALVSTNGPWITFMKLRLDRVLSGSYEADSVEEALASNPTKLEFEKPKKWLAPYRKYESGWWETFLLPGSQQPES